MPPPKNHTPESYAFCKAAMDRANAEEEAACKADGRRRPGPDMVPCSSPCPPCIEGGAKLEKESGCLRLATT